MYKMATESDNKPLDCPLCFTRFTSPRVLPCLHTFCEKCLGEHIETTAGLHGFACPLCTAQTAPSDYKKIAQNKWVSAFPLNTLVDSLLKVADVSNNNDKICEPCSVDDEINTAEFWCTNCFEKLCASCNKSHRRMKQLQDHTIVPIDDMKQYKFNCTMFDQSCVRHRDDIKHFCVDHKEPCCAMCLHHRPCIDYRCIDEIARETEQQFSSSAYPAIIKDIGELRVEMEKLRSEKSNNVAQVQKEKGQILNDIDGRIDKIIADLNAIRNSFRNDANQRLIDTEHVIMKHEKQIRSFLTNLDNSEGILEVVEKNGTSQQKFLIFGNISSQITSQYRHLKSRLQEDVEIHFTIGKNLSLSSIETTVSSFKGVEICSSSSQTNALNTTDRVVNNLNSHMKIKSKLSHAQVPKKEKSSSDVILVKAVTRKTQHANACCTSGTYMDDGRLVLADYNEKRLYEFDDEYCVVKVRKIGGHPRDLAAGRNNELYVTVFKDNEYFIYKYKVDSELKVLRRFKSPFGTLGIAVSGENVIAGTYNAVVILSEDGSTVKSIPKAGHNCFVAVSQKTRQIYHKDSRAIICRSLDGKELFKFKHPEVRTPLGLCIDTHGNVLFTENNSRSIHKLSADLQRSTVFEDVIRNISQPISIMFHPRKNEFAVTSQNEDTMLEVFKIN